MKRDFVPLNEGTAGTTSLGLLEQARARDATAWDQLVRLYSRSMYRWCRRAGLQSADAANVVQEALGAVARKLGDFRRDQPGDSFRGWIHRITENKIRDHYRRLQRQADQAEGGTTGYEKLVDKARWEDAEDATWDTSLTTALATAHQPVEEFIAQIRASISERDWRFFWRVVVDGQSAVEVAEEFQVTANTVRLVKMRVLRKLRQLAASSTDMSQERDFP